MNVRCKLWEKKVENKTNKLINEVLQKVSFILYNLQFKKTNKGTLLTDNMLLVFKILVRFTCIAPPESIFSRLILICWGCREMTAEFEIGDVCLPSFSIGSIELDLIKGLNFTLLLIEDAFVDFVICGWV